MKKKLIIFFLVLTTLGAGLYFYINNYFLPVQLRQIISRKAREYLNRTISFKEIRYHPLKGIVIKELTIYQKDNPREPFFSATEIYGNLLITPLLKNKKIIIPSLTVEKPGLYISRLNAQEWNFSDLLDKRSAPDKKPPFEFLLGSLIIQDGFLSFTDLSLEQPQSSLFKDLQAQFKLSLKDGLTFDLKTWLLEQPSSAENVSPGLLHAKGRYHPLSKEMNATLIAQNISLARYVNLFYQNPNLDLKQGLVERARLDIRQQKDVLRVSGNIQAAMDLALAQQRCKGNFNAKDFILDKDRSQLTFSGTLDIAEARINLNDQEFFEGSGSVKIKNLTVADKQLAFEGDIETTPSKFQWQAGRGLSGALTLTGLNLKRGENELTFATQLNVKDTQARFDDTFKLKGDVSAPSLSGSFINGIVSLKTSLRIDAADIQIQDNKHFAGTIIADETSLNLTSGETSANGKLELKDALMTFDGKTFSGSPLIDYEFIYNTQTQKSNPLIYKGTFKITQGVLEHIPRVGLIKNIDGAINFRTDYFQTEALSLTVDDIPLAVSGSLTDIASPALDIKAQIKKADLEKLYSYVPAQFKQSPLKPSGAVDLQLAYKGTLAAPDAADINVTAALSDCSVAGLKMPKDLPDQITNIAGIVKYKNGIVSWNKLRGLFLNESYELNGQMENLANPRIETEVISAATDFYARLSIADRVITISALKGLYKNAAFDITGEIQGQGPGLFYDIDGKVDLDAAQLKDVWPPLKERLDSFKPSGRLALAVRFKGRGENLEKALMNASLASPDLTLNGYHLTDLAVDLKHSPGQTGELNAHALFYQGNFAVASFFDLSKTTWPLEITAQLKNTDLALLRKDSQWKGQDLAGTLNIDASAAGSLKDLNTLNGKGALSISNGNIWNLKILEGVWKLLFIPEFEGVIFTEAYVPFVIKDRRINTDNLILKGATADMTGQGWIDFDKNLNFIVSPVFRQTDVFKSESIKKGLSSLLAETDGYIEITIAGTLDQPHYSVNTRPTKMLKKATDALFEGVGDVLNDLF